MDGGETSAHIFVGYDLKIIDVYNAKGNSGKGFLVVQDRDCTRGVPTELVADNAHMYRGRRITKFLRNVITPLWQYETKYQHQNLAENRYKTVKRKKCTFQATFCKSLPTSN